MKFWKMVGVNSDLFLGLEGKFSTGSEVHLAATEVFLRILLRNRGMKIKFKKALKMIYKR